MICVYTMVLVVVVIVLLTRVSVLMPVTIPKRGGALSWRRHGAGPGVESDRGRVPTGDAEGTSVRDRICTMLELRPDHEQTRHVGHAFGHYSLHTSE